MEPQDEPSSKGIECNNLLKKHQTMNSEAEIQQEKLEILLNKCPHECQLIDEALEKKHNECQHQISEIDMLRAKCEALTNQCLEKCEPKYEAPKRILAEETAEKKRFYNELTELRGNIRVFCRCRPLSTKETSKGYTSVIEFDPSKDNELQITCTDSSRKIFKFDHVFSPKDDQEAVFSETLPVMKSVMDGYNACIFAYGKTGTGKTFTMEGTPECRGVNYRALEELFRIMKERMSLMQYEFSFSMLEVYNEKIRDLLADNSDLSTKKWGIKQSAEGTQEVPGLAEIQVSSIYEVWEMHKSGAKNRSVGSTLANELSSRSHSLVRVTVKGENMVTGERSKSFLWLVDLAGSKRVGKIEAEGGRLKESQFINKSLSAFGDVISSLVSKSSHIPYRNSKLTHLLQSSLCGNCKILMIAQISPSLADLGETLCTLNFASKACGVEHGLARKQTAPVDNLKFKQMVEKLRQEEIEANRLNEKLNKKIRESEQACENYQLKIKDPENQLVEEKKGRSQSAIASENSCFESGKRPPTIIEQLRELSNIAKTMKTSISLKTWSNSRLKADSVEPTTSKFSSSSMTSDNSINKNFATPEERFHTKSTGLKKAQVDECVDLLNSATKFGSSTTQPTIIEQLRELSNIAKTIKTSISLKTWSNSRLKADSVEPTTPKFSSSSMTSDNSINKNFATLEERFHTKSTGLKKAQVDECVDLLNSATKIQMQAKTYIKEFVHGDFGCTIPRWEMLI